jgi:pectinesterase
MLFGLSFIAVVASMVLADSKNERITPSRGAIVVDASGKLQNSFRNISAAVNALLNTTSAQTIYIAPGTYTEQVYFRPLAGPLTVQGYTKDARSYKDNKVTITGNLSRQTPGIPNNDATATVRLWTSNVKFYNLDIANTFGEAITSGQALALSAQNTNQGFYGCSFTGYQDTIYANEGRQIYAKSFINGNIVPVPPKEHCAN